jgi:hypothetical protein
MAGRSVFPTNRTNDAPDLGPDQPCSIVTYCTAKTNSLGCAPSIGASGRASASTSSGFVVTAVDVRNNKSGLLLYGVHGRAAIPFQGGILCVQKFIFRSPGRESGGTPKPAADCSGIFSLDMNAYASGALGGKPLQALGVAGTVVNCQWWGRDVGFSPPENTTLSNALEYTVCP